MSEASPQFRGHIYDSLLDTIGATPVVRLSRLAKAENVKAEILGKCEFFNPALFGEGPHRPRHDRASGSLRRIEARRHAGRADQRQHRHRARLRRRGQGLSPDPHHAGEHVDRAAQDAAPAGSGAGTDAGRPRHERRHPARPSSSPRKFRTRSYRSNSAIPPIRISTARPRRKRSSRIATASSTISSRVSAPAARSPGSAKR